MLAFATGLRFVLLAAAGRLRARAGVHAHLRRADMRAPSPTFSGLRPPARRTWSGETAATIRVGQPVAGPAGAAEPVRGAGIGDACCCAHAPRRRPEAGARSAGAGTDPLGGDLGGARHSSARDHAWKANLSSVSRSHACRRNMVQLLQIMHNKRLLPPSRKSEFFLKEQLEAE